MTIDKQIQEQLNYHPFQQIDAATGAPADMQSFNALEQAVTVTFLAAVYKSTRLKENAAIIAKKTDAGKLLNLLFDDKFDAYQAIADYSNQPLEPVKLQLTKVAGALINIVQQQPQETRAEYLQSTFTSERDHILTLIPSQLKIEKLLNDDTINDNTNKMQGPVSTLMHKIENTFSTSD